MSDELSGPVRNVLAAVDLTPRSQMVILATRRVVCDRSVRIVLLHVVSDLQSLLGVYSTGSPMGPLQTDIEENARAQLEALHREHLGDYENAVVEQRKGPIWSEIVASAIANRADLIFMGSHFSDKPRSKSVGDLVSKVTRISPCPVVVVPSAEI